MVTEPDFYETTAADEMATAYQKNKQEKQNDCFFLVCVFLALII